MRYRAVGIFLLVALGMLVVPLATAAPPGKVWRLGVLSAQPPTDGLPVVGPFLEGLHELGYTEGQNLVMEWRWAEAREQRLPALEH